MATLTQGGGGANIQNINQTKLSALNVPFPSDIRQQEQIAAKLAEIRSSTDRLKRIYAQKLVALEDLRQSLLEEAFTGQLTSKAVEQELTNV